MSDNTSAGDILIEPAKNLTTGGTEELNIILQDLHAACLDVQLSMVATQDGLTMASLGTVVEPDQVGAMCSELQTVCDKTAYQLEQGILDLVLLKCSEGNLLLTTAGDYAVLAVMTKSESNIGMVILESQRAAEAIKKSFI